MRLTECCHIYVGTGSRYGLGNWSQQFFWLVQKHNCIFRKLSSFFFPLLNKTNFTSLCKHGYYKSINPFHPHSGRWKYAKKFVIFPSTSQVLLTVVKTSLPKQRLPSLFSHQQSQMLPVFLLSFTKFSSICSITLILVLPAIVHLLCRA